MNALATFVAAKAKLSERGASLVEYALLVALIAVICIAAVTAIGRNGRDAFERVADTLAGGSPSFA